MLQRISITSLSHVMMRIALESPQYHLYHPFIITRRSLEYVCSNSHSNPGSTRSRRVVTVGVGIKDDDGNDDVNVKTFLGKIGDTYVDIADFTTLSTDDSVEDATCGQVCSPLPDPLPNYVLGVDSTNGCDAGLKMNYDTRCDVQCDTSLGYEAGTGYYECPENGGDPILNINCQQASCEVNQRVLNGACVACPPGT